MRFVSFLSDGRESFGLVEGDQVRDLGPTGAAAATSLRNAMEQGDLARLAERTGPLRPLAGLRLLPPVEARKILCIGLNYRKHAEEAGMAIPAKPSVFVRFADSQVGHGDDVVRPRASEQFDYEGELAVVIGRRARNVAPADALSYVAGYACFAENSVRDFQRHSNQATPGKNFWRSGAFGPWLVTADEIADPDDLLLTTRLNGEVVQRESTADMIFAVPQLIAYLSSFTPLLPGDVISTGTPSGVGFVKKPPVYLKPGDRLEVEIEGIGTLAHGVVDESDSPSA